MNRRFKERLIGAFVLVGAAVVILPAVLNGPHPLPAQPAAAPAGEATTVRSETIELVVPPATPPAPPPDNASAPAEEAAAPEAKEANEPVLGPAPAAAQGSPVVPAPPVQRAVPAIAPEPAPARTPTPLPPAQPRPKAEAMQGAVASGWAVQVGNFASQSNAEALTAGLKARGYDAFISPRVAGDKTYFRVRVGPTADVDAARALEQRLEKDGQPDATVVRHP